MSGLKHLIRETHRRSLWQVLAVYVGASWLVFEAAQTLTEGLGLPAWVPPYTFVLLLIGLPIVLATAFIQKGITNRSVRDATLLPELAAGARSPDLGDASLGRLLNWRNALGGGVLAFTALAIGVAGYMTMRTLGIGPLGTLIAKGVLEPRDRILLADFEDHANDSTLTLAAAGALRVDLSQSPVVRVADFAYVRRALERMERDPSTSLDAALAREIAIREGLKALITGAVYQVGDDHVISVELVSTQSGAVLVAHRETAATPAEIVPAIDRLSAKLRERIGESLKSIRGSEPLARVTTPSLEALRAFTLATQADRRTEHDEAIALYEEAIRLDSTFALAYTRVARILGNLRIRRARMIEAQEKALQYADRLPERERLQVRAGYHWNVTGDWHEVATVSRALRNIDPECCLNTLAGAYTFLSDWTTSERFYRQALKADSGRSIHPYRNLMLVQIAQGELQAAESTWDALAKRFPDHHRVLELATYLAAVQGDYERAETHARMLRETKNRPSAQSEANTLLAGLAQLRGRLTEAERYWREAMTVAERRGLPAEYVRGALRLAEIDLWLRNDPGGAVRTVEAVLERFPLDSMAPVDRPCLPNELGIHPGLCVFWALAGEPERARQLLSEFEARAGSSLTWWEERRLLPTRALIALAEGEHDEAIATLRRYDRLEPCGPCPLPFLGLAYEAAGQRDSARAVFERYTRVHDIGRLDLDRNLLPIAYERLGHLYEEAGQRADAIRYYSRLVDLWQDADPELQPRVTAARRAIARLSEE